MPGPVLRQAAEKMLVCRALAFRSWMSRHAEELIAIQAEAEALLRELLAVPASDRALFMQGRAIGEDAIAPMNCCAARPAPTTCVGNWPLPAPWRGRPEVRLSRGESPLIQGVAPAGVKQECRAAARTKCSGSGIVRSPEHLR